MRTALTLAACLFCAPVLAVDQAQLPASFDLAQKKTRKRPGGVLRLYKKATSLYDQRKYDDAISVYSRILKIYPSHEPSRIYIAKSLYRLGRHRQAYRLFKQLDLSTLDPETSFEYGQTFYRRRRYEGALEAFQRVPSGHPLLDLASYYGGVSALRLKKYPEAVGFFDQAVVLPSKLMRSKKALQKQAEDMMLAEQRKNLNEANPGPNPRPPTPEPSGPISPKTPKPPSYVSPGFLIANNQVSGFVDVDSQEQDFSGVRSVSTSQTWLGVDGQVGYDIPLGSSETPNPSHFHTSLGLRAQSGSTSESSLAITEDYDHEIETLLINRTQASTIARAHLDLAPEWNIGNNSWLGFGASYIHLVSDGDSSLSASLPSVYLQLGQQNQNYSLLLRARYTNVNVDQAQYMERTDELLAIEAKVSEKVSVKGVGMLSQFSYSQSTTDGPDWLGRLYGQVMYSFTPKLAMGARGHYEQLGGNRLHNLNSIPVVGFEQDNIGGGLVLKGVFTDWLSAEASVVTHDRKVQSIEPDSNETRVAITENFATYTTAIVAKLRAQYRF
ncbi:tetratricopeptide repeat protein [Pseudobacteriovorax antillogorgiicola]|nr:tetratricopeptide repeat protein [Pseudobacteriovorax antillogorgiicola]